MPIYYKIIKRCIPCGTYSKIDRKPFEHGAIYNVGCKGCRVSYQFYAGLYEIGESQKYSYDNGVHIKLIRVK